MADSTLTILAGVDVQASTVTTGVISTSDSIKSLMTREPHSFSGGLVTPTAAPPINSSYFTSLQRATPQLTTFFKPPPDCTEGLFTSNISTFGTLVCTKEHTSSCFPPSFTAADLGGVYSPGACPHGYNNGDPWVVSAATSVTSCVCCPGQMTFNAVAQTCEGLMPASTSVIQDNRTVQQDESFTAFGQAVVIAWQSSDLESFSPASAPVLGYSSNSNSTDSEQSSSNGLPTDAKIGVGVGVTVGILLVGSLLGSVLYRRFRRGKGSAVSVDEKLIAVLPTSLAEQKAELGSDGHIQEIGGRKVLAEADGTDVRHELEGDWQGYEVSGAKSTK